MGTEKDDITALLAWTKQNYDSGVYEDMVKQGPHSKKDFWAALKKAKATVAFHGMKPFKFGRLRCNSHVRR